VLGCSTEALSHECRQGTGRVGSTRRLIGEDVVTPEPERGVGPKAVFVDPAGRRRRVLVGAGAAASVLLVAFLIAIAVALIGGGTSILPGLPSAAKHARSGHEATQPAARPKPTSDAGPSSTQPAPSPSPSVTPSPSASPSPTKTHPNNGRSPTSRPSHSHP
jgi:hypothetical protein